MLKVTLKRSAVGYSVNHKRTVEALGLGKLNSSNMVPDNLAIRGMIHKVAFLVVVEEVAEKPKRGKKDVSA
jgi:large subunit ribosomal protein L30